jgi:hypothetical protein
MCVPVRIASPYHSLTFLADHACCLLYAFSFLETHTAAAGGSAEQFHTAARNVVFPGGLQGLLTGLSALGKLLQTGLAGELAS